MYSLEIGKKCHKDIKKHSKKNRPMEEALGKAVEKILENPEQFKPLRAPLQNMRRMHVLGSYVLIYEIKGDVVRLLRFAHHDEAYR